MPALPIPHFALYGEHTPLADAELIHLELIETRSRPHDWHIAPHTHSGMFQVLFLLGGTVRAGVDGADWVCAGPMVITIHPGVVHGFAFSEHAHGFVLTLDQRALAGDRSGQHGGMFTPLFLQPLRIPLAAAAGRLEALLQQLLIEFSAPRQGHDVMLDWLARSVLLLVLRQHTQHQQQSSADQGGRAGFDTFGHFRDLLEAHYLEQWHVARYAACLHMTESRLNRMCLRLGGKSAFDMTQQRLMLEARRKLMYLPGSVASIAYELGFQDPAYFSRTFKRETGMTPKAYRLRSLAGPETDPLN